MQAYKVFTDKEGLKNGVKPVQWKKPHSKIIPNRKNRKVVEFEKELISGIKILIVDDTPANLEILGHILQLSGLEVSIVPTGEKAL